MKATISERNRYLLGYLCFSLLFIGILVFLIFFGTWLTERSPSSDRSAPSAFSSDALPIIILDPGHGGEDGGTVGVNGIYEKDINLAVAQKINTILRTAGIATVMTRTEDVLLYDKNSDYQGQKKVQDLLTRRKIAETYDNAIFVSIHMNAFPESQYHGLQVYYSTNSAESIRLAEEIQTITTEWLLPNNTRRIKAAGSNIYLLDRLHCPAVLIECGFLSNPEECQNLSTEEYQQQLALTISLAIIYQISQISENGT